MSAEKGCCDNTRQNPPSIINGMRVTGFLLFALSVAEFGVGGKVYGMMTNVKLGAWWGGILGALAGIFGIVAVPHGMIISAIVFGSFALVVAAVGSAVDGIAYLVFKSETSCADTSLVKGTYDYYNGWTLTSGTAGLYGDYEANGAVLLTCALANTGYQCVCTDGVTFCGLYDMTSGNTCGDILTVYTPLLQASTGLNAVISILAFIVSVIGCAAACNCVKPLDDGSNGGNAK